MTRPARNLYEQDFYLWTRDQAAELRRAASERANLPLDWENLAEEIESLGRSDRRELSSRLRNIVEHLLKLAYAPVEEPRRGWRLSVRNQRIELAQLLRDSPSLRRDAADLLAECHAEASETIREGMPPAEASQWPPLPDTCPFTLDQILDRDWWPESRFS